MSPDAASGEFYLPGDHSTPIDALSMTAGQQTAEVDFRSTNANGGNPHLILIVDNDPPPLSGSVNVTVLPGPVSQAASFVAASTPVVAGVSPSAVTVTVTDQYGNPVSGVVVSLACTGYASHTNPGAPTGSDGKATGAVMDNKAEAVTVTATAGGLPLADNAIVSFVPGPASGATSQVDAASPAVADGSSQSQITVTALDQFGNPVSGVPVSLSAAPSGQGETLTQPPGLTDANGHAYGYIRSTKTGSWTVSSVINGTPVADGATILFAPGAVDRFEWSVDGAAVAGEYEDVTLTVRDELNNIVTDYADTAFVSTTSAGPELWATGGGAAGETDSLANGQWFYVFDAADNGSAALRVRVRRAGSITLFAQRGGANGTSSTITVDNGPADKIAIVSGDDQTAVAGSAVAADLVVRVTDEFGNLVDGASVTFGNVTGGGSRDVVGGGAVDSVATTNGSGEARCDVWQLGDLRRLVEHGHREDRERKRPERRFLGDGDTGSGHGHRLEPLEQVGHGERGGNRDRHAHRRQHESRPGKTRFDFHHRRGRRAAQAQPASYHNRRNELPSGDDGRERAGIGALQGARDGGAPGYCRRHGRPGDGGGRGGYRVHERRERRDESSLCVARREHVAGGTDFFIPCGSGGWGTETSIRGTRAR